MRLHFLLCLCFCSVARDNPLYVEPAIVTEEGADGATETTPLDS